MHRVLCIGDSNTYGFDPRSYLGGRYPADRRWTGILQASGRWNVQNCGENGRGIPYRKAELAALETLLQAKPGAEIITVMLGSNDLLEFPPASAEAVTERMEMLLRRLQGTLTAMGSSAALLLVAPPPMQPGAWVAETRLLTESARLGTCYRALAEALALPFADASAWRVELTFDGVHFSEAGHRAFATGIEPVLVSLLQGD